MAENAMKKNIKYTALGFNSFALVLNIIPMFQKISIFRILLIVLNGFFVLWFGISIYQSGKVRRDVLRKIKLGYKNKINMTYAEEEADMINQLIKEGILDGKAFKVISQPPSSKNISIHNSESKKNKYAKHI